MQKALESFLGPAAGLIGLFIFILIWTPKLVVKWRGSRARKAEQAKMKLVHDASRSLVLEPQGVDDIEDHIMHGRAIRSFKTAKSRAIIICLALCLPLALIYFLVPAGYMSMRVYLLIAGTFFAFLGLMTLRHLGDSATFYKTGAVWRTNGKRYDIDYNTIVDVTTRSALIPGAACRPFRRWITRRTRRLLYAQWPRPKRRVRTPHRAAYSQCCRRKQTTHVVDKPSMRCRFEAFWGKNRQNRQKTAKKRAFKPS